MQTTVDAAQLKVLLREALEDIALPHAIQAEEQSETTSREDVFRVLAGNDQPEYFNNPHSAYLLS